MLTTTPSGLEEIIETFGDLNTRNFERRYITPFTLPYPLYYEGIKVMRARCHYLLVDNFIKAFKDIQEAGLEAEARNYSGIYNPRNVRGGSHPSAHSWGIAIDLEAGKYPLGSSKRFPEQIIEIFADAGFFYGGDFSRRKDPMHFQFCKDY
jgi:hypothetical protein